MSDYIEKILLASTAHLTEWEYNTELPCMIDDGRVDLIMRREHGYLIHVESNIEYMTSTLWSQRIPNLIPLLELAVQEEAVWLMLDGDGHQHDHLAIFDW